MSGITLGLVCARSGSTGLPGKNLLRLDGERLIERAIRIAWEAGCDDVAVSTDYVPGEDFDTGGASWVFRPDELAGPDVSKWHVWRHAVEFWECGAREAARIVDVDVTRPLGTAETVRRTIAALDEYPVVVAVTHANKHPAFDILAHTSRGVRPYDNATDYVTRQQLSPAYFHAGAYGFTRDELFGRSGLYDGGLWLVLTDRIESFDINDELDWQVVQALHASAHVTASTRLLRWPVVACHAGPR